MTKEYFLRFIQHLFSWFLWDSPVLSSIKMLIYKIFWSIGKNSYISRNSYFVSPHSRKYAKLLIGKNVGIEHGCDIDYSGGVEIGDGVWISENVLISTHGHDIQTKEKKKNQPVLYSSLVISDDAWIGANSIVLGKVCSIGKGAIIGAGSIVTRDVPDWAVVGGNPADFIRYRTNEDISNIQK